MKLLFKEQIGNVVFIERDVFGYVSSLLEEIENKFGKHYDDFFIKELKYKFIDNQYSHNPLSNSEIYEEIEEYIEDTETFDEFQELFFTGY